jgi:hypothetical protein
MSLSREIALLSKNPAQFADAMLKFAKKIVAEGGSRRLFDRRLRPVFSAMHRGGFATDELKELRREARRIFRLAAGLGPVSASPEGRGGQV